MDWCRTDVLAIVFDWLKKIEWCRKAANIMIFQRHYLDALVDTPLLPGESTRFSAQMRIYTASGTAQKY